MLDFLTERLEICIRFLIVSEKPSLPPFPSPLAHSDFLKLQRRYPMEAVPKLEERELSLVCGIPILTLMGSTNNAHFQNFFYVIEIVFLFFLKNLIAFHEKNGDQKDGSA